jgi:hypothetical protein
MFEVSAVGGDLAKNVIQVHTLNEGATSLPYAAN